jgi:hypothetical protein
LSALGAVFSLGTLGSAATAADVYLPSPHGPPLSTTLEPAVSGFNGKIAIMGGVWKDAPASNFSAVFGGKQHTVGILEGSLSAPLGHSFGVQVDGAVGTDEAGHNMWGVGGHLFWRDPAQGLAGLIGSYSTRVDDYLGGATERQMIRTGAEGEIYFEQFTAAARGGYQWVTIQQGDTLQGLFGSIDLMWYVTPDLMVRGGGEYSEGPGGAFTAGLEFQPSHVSISGLTFFADGALGDESYRALGGLRYYFGAGSKSLIDRHRKDDPSNLVTQSFSGFQQQYFR